ncbi:MAG: hypothetical protein JRG91_06300 [Deltaproteobacteria bacterium]|nr:hypothetical protein [Deltaproteobacteria bacterium]
MPRDSDSKKNAGKSSTEQERTVDEPGGEERFRRLFGEKLMPEILRRGVESGMDTFLRSDRGVRKAISDLKLHRELTNYFFHQVDETKNSALRVIAREVREFLENTDLDEALRSVLTSLAFEIRTEVRFVPVDGTVKPQVKSAVAKTKKVKGARKSKAGKKAAAPRKKRRARKA